jgi:prepilin-type N-terminal cleavage/methylation domain-containing protein
MNRRGFSLIELLVVIAIIAILLALTLAGVQKVRESANRLKCQNNLKQIVLGLVHHDDAKGHLPPGIYDPDGDSPFASVGWQVGLLPYVEQKAVYDRAITDFERTKNYAAMPQHAGLGTFIATYACPSDGRISGPVRPQRHTFTVGTTGYLGSCGLRCTKPDGVLFPDSKISLRDVSDGLSNTIFVGERPPSVDFELGWWYAGQGQLKTGSAEMILGVRERYFGGEYAGCAPVNEYGPGKFSDGCHAFHFWSPHAGGAWFAFGDGSVRFLAFSANPIMPALASRAGGDTVAVPD